MLILYHMGGLALYPPRSPLYVRWHRGQSLAKSSPYAGPSAGAEGCTFTGTARLAPASCARGVANGLPT